MKKVWIVLAVAAGLIIVGAPTAAHATEQCIPQEAYTETIEHPAEGDELVANPGYIPASEHSEVRGIIKYTWTGGPTSEAPPFPGAGWNNAGVTNDSKVTPGYVHKGNGKGSWFYFVENVVTVQVPAVGDEFIPNPAYVPAWTEEVEHEGVSCPDVFDPQIQDYYFCDGADFKLDNRSSDMAVTYRINRDEFVVEARDWMDAPRVPSVDGGYMVTATAPDYFREWNFPDKAKGCGVPMTPLEPPVLVDPEPVLEEGNQNSEVPRNVEIPVQAPIMPRDEPEVMVISTPNLVDSVPQLAMTGGTGYYSLAAFGTIAVLAGAVVIYAKKYKK